MRSRLSRPTANVLLAALIGSLLMFAGWVLAIVPAFHHLGQLWLVLAIALVMFGLVLIPSGLDFYFWPAASDSKRGIGAILWSMIPALVLMLFTVAVLPTAPIVRIVAIVVEIAGMGMYGWAWWMHRNPPGEASPAPQRLHAAS